MINRSRINTPTKAVTDPNYIAECQFALEPSVYRLMELATEVGWDHRQAATAIAMLAAKMAGDDLNAKYDA